MAQEITQIEPPPNMRMQSDAATRPQDRSHFGTRNRSTNFAIYLGGAADAQSVGRAPINVIYSMIL